MQITFLEDSHIGATPHAAGSTVTIFPAHANALIQKGAAVEILADGTARSRRGRPRTDTPFIVNADGHVVPNTRDLQPGRARAEAALAEPDRQRGGYITEDIRPTDFRSRRATTKGD